MQALERAPKLLIGPTRGGVERGAFELAERQRNAVVADEREREDHDRIERAPCRLRASSSVLAGIGDIFLNRS